MTPEEHGLLETVEGDYCKVQCKVCDKKMSKRSVFVHLKQHHPEFVEASWEWVVKKDYNLMKNKKAKLDQNSPFTKSWANYAAGDEAPPEPDDAAEQLALHDAAPAAPVPDQEEAPPPPLALEDEGPPTPVPDQEGLQEQGEAPPTPQHASQYPEVSQVDVQPAQVDVQPAPAGLAIQLHALEDRILTRTDEIVGGFNQVLQVGLGEVQAKYKVSLAEWLVDWDSETQGRTRAHTHARTHARTYAGADKIFLCLQVRNFSPPCLQISVFNMKLSSRFIMVYPSLHSPKTSSV